MPFNIKYRTVETFLVSTLFLLLCHICSLWEQPKTNAMQNALRAQLFVRIFDLTLQQKERSIPILPLPQRTMVQAEGQPYRH